MFARIISRHGFELCIRDLNIISENPVEPDFQGIDPCAPDLPGLIISDPSQTLLLQAPQFIKLGMIPCPDHLPLILGQRHIRIDRSLKFLPQRNGIPHRKKKIAGRLPFKSLLKLRGPHQGMTNGQKVPRGP